MDYADLDLNIWHDEENGVVRLTVYPVLAYSDGALHTYTGTILVSVPLVTLSVDDYDRDGEWIGWKDALPGSIPREALDLVNEGLQNGWNSGRLVA